MNKEEIQAANQNVEANTGINPDPNFYPQLVKPGGIPVGFSPIQLPKEEIKNKPTLGETFGANFRQYNLPYRVGKYVIEGAQEHFYRDKSGDTTIEMGFDAIKDGYVNRVPEEYIADVLWADSKEDAEIIINKINEELEDKDIAQRSGMIANLVTTLGATALDPTILIPFSQTVKYSTVSRGLYANMINTAKTMGPAIALQNAVLVGSKETEGLTDWAYQSLFETFLAAGIGGVLGGFAAKGAQAEIKNAKGVFSAIKDDVDIRYKLNEKGEVTGALAVPQPGGSVGAKAIEDIQALLDSGQVDFRNKGWVKTAFGWGSPIIKGVTNRFETVRLMTNDLFPNVFETASGVTGAIKGPDAYSFVKLWRSTNENAGIHMHAQWLDFLGLKGPGKSARATAGSWSGKYMSYEEFSELTAKAHRRGGQSDIPQVAAAAKIYNDEVYQPLFKELQKRYPEMTEHQFSNISSYLNRVYDKNKIMQNPDAFLRDVEKYLHDVNQRIFEKQAPIRLAEASGNKELAAELQAALDKEIADGLIDLDMLQGKPKLTSEQIEKINKIQAPIKEAEKILETSREELKKLGTLKNLKEFLKEDLKGVASGAISDVAASIEKFGINKTLKAVKKYRSSIVAAEKKIAEQSSNLRAKIKEQNDLVKGLQNQKGDKKSTIKVMEEKLAALPSSDKKQIRSLKTMIANEKKNLENIPNLIKEAKEARKPLQVELAGIKDAREYIDISKETAGDALPFVKKAIENLSEKELDKQIKMIEQGIRRINREGLQLGKIKRNEIRRKIKKAKEDIALGKEKIQSDISAGVIPEDLFYYGKFGAYLHDVNANPKLRGALTKEQIKEAAESIRNNITQLNEEQVLGEIFNSVTSGGNDPFMTRTLLWNDAVAEPWLLNRMDVLSGLYTDQIAKRIYFDDIAKQYGADRKEGIKGIVKNLTGERADAEKAILKQPDSPARAKELEKLNKDFKDAEKFLNDMYKIYMGNYVDKTTAAYRITDGVKKFAVSTLLGNLPILQLTEFFSPFFRFTFGEYINDGLVQTLTRMQKLGKGGAYDRGIYADIGLGVNRYIGNRTQALAGYGAQYQPKTVAERVIDNLAKFSQQFSLANFIMDAQEVMVGGMAESSLIRTLKKYQSGEKLLKSEVDILDRARLNPQLYAERILNQYKKHGQDVEGAFNPNFHLWDDADAARQFRISVEKKVREVLIQPGPIDSPFIFKDPMISLLTQFTSYIFAATNNFTVPLLTKPDLQKASGMIMMMAAGSMVGPLRSLAKGEELDLSFDALAGEAMNNSGVFGWQYDALLRLNSTFDNILSKQEIGGIKPFKFMETGRMNSKALELGPASGIYSMARSFLSALANGEMNEKDASRGLRLIAGFGYNWYTRQSIDAMINSFNLPKDRKTAKALKGIED